jgi:hypothetical protein
VQKGFVCSARASCKIVEEVEDKTTPEELAMAGLVWF